LCLANSALLVSHQIGVTFATVPRPPVIWLTVWRITAITSGVTADVPVGEAFFFAVVSSGAILLTH
jgi:hypothetical protein